MYWTEERVGEMTSSEVMKLTKRWYSNKASVLLDEAELVDVEMLEPDETSAYVPLEVTIKLQVNMPREYFAHIPDSPAPSTVSVNGEPAWSSGAMPSKVLQAYVDFSGKVHLTDVPPDLPEGRYVAAIVAYAQSTTPGGLEDTNKQYNSVAYEDMYSDHTSEEF